jgi:hypothetical protein
MRYQGKLVNYQNSNGVAIVKGLTGCLINVCGYDYKAGALELGNDIEFDLERSETGFRARNIILSEVSK